MHMQYNQIVFYFSRGSHEFQQAPLIHIDINIQICPHFDLIDIPFNLSDNLISLLTNQATSPLLSLHDRLSQLMSPYPLYYLGNMTRTLNDMNNAPLAIMVPCGVGYDSEGDINSISFANITGASACAPDVTFIYTISYAAFGKNESYTHNITFTGTSGTAGVEVTSCGAAVSAADGQLPAELCSVNIGQMVTFMTNATNDIGNDTAIFLYYPSGRIPSGTPFLLSVSIRLKSSLIPKAAVSLIEKNPLPIFTSQTNNLQPDMTPSQRRGLYNAPLQSLGTARGTLTDVAIDMFDYNMSPWDLVAANEAFGADGESLQASYQ